MRVFVGSLRLAARPADTLAAAVTVDDTRLVVRSGDYEIGAWTLHDLAITGDIDGFHLEVDGEELILTLRDRSGFAAMIGALQAGSRRAQPAAGTRRSRRRTDSSGRGAGSDRARPRPPAAIRRPLDMIRNRVEEMGGVPIWWVWVVGGFLGLVVLAFLSPTTVAVLLVVPGLASLLAGALALTDSSVRVRLPGPFEPPAFLATGLVLLAAGFTVFGLA